MMLEAGAIQARGGTLPGRTCCLLVAFAVESRPVHVHEAAPCMYTVSVYKLAHIRAVHTIHETGHGYGLSLGAGFQFFHVHARSQGRAASPRRPPLCGCRDIGHELFNDRLMSS